jgi:hypothetical protein
MMTGAVTSDQMLFDFRRSAAHGYVQVEEVELLNEALKQTTAQIDKLAEILLRLLQQLADQYRERTEKGKSKQSLWRRWWN